MPSNGTATYALLYQMTRVPAQHSCFGLFNVRDLKLGTQQSTWLHTSKACHMIKGVPQTLRDSTLLQLIMPMVHRQPPRTACSR